VDQEYPASQPRHLDEAPPPIPSECPGFLLDQEPILRKTRRLCMILFPSDCPPGRSAARSGDPVFRERRGFWISDAMLRNVHEANSN
jgi:hypothetical protein